MSSRRLTVVLGDTGSRGVGSRHGLRVHRNTAPTGERRGSVFLGAKKTLSACNAKTPNVRSPTGRVAGTSYGDPHYWSGSPQESTLCTTDGRGDTPATEEVTSLWQGNL